ncbi:[FeFe] hydrogenase H-cluster maturation GTPase HydF [Culicoidibacter larvae]|uniref:[FeFe] hydrogenase H-cluster maturation GTPase HydF n=1 Tax=Culicoidibacter larvae TaxID=2579976 RepID=A0A5R8QBR7_9FIRM|nr:[FeFe] hydrogenase H-cluster maturation GTPase HydF [Culicoidibacter larvae]TLG73774.1 [FeFe] hydrogenase H-cluster maturation GTPase HydF [Culicoidibacter larvae]
MQKTPLSNRLHIALIGPMNAGKSSLMNALSGQDLAIVSEVAGTTTDPIVKAVEIIGLGPVAFIDTAGLNDKSELGAARVKKTKQMLKRANAVCLVFDASNFNEAEIAEVTATSPVSDAQTILIFNKIDKLSAEERSALNQKFPDALLISAEQNFGTDMVRDALIQCLQDIQEEHLIGDLLPPGSIIILVTPIDSEAPKGRLILPQVQVLRDCLDYGHLTTVVQVDELAKAIEVMQPDIVITDSQAFKEVATIVPDDIFLTSFSILFARQKGDLQYFVNSLQDLDTLTNPRVAIIESCSHNFTHEDIGRFKIPNFLKKKFGENISIDFYMGNDFVERMDDYDLLIHCGGCMTNRQTIQSRVETAREYETPMINYGMFLAYATGTLDRALLFFEDKI